MANTTTTRTPGSPGFTDIKDKAQDTASGMMETARDTASSVADKAREVARDVASGVGQRVSDTASQVGHRADEAVSSVGGGIKSLAGSIREHGPHSGKMGSASTGVADTLDKAGRYLEEQGLSGIGEDLTSLVRRNPIPALFIGIGIGFLVARATMPSRS